MSAHLTVHEMALSTEQRLMVRRAERQARLGDALAHRPTTATPSPHWAIPAAAPPPRRTTARARGTTVRRLAAALCGLMGLAAWATGVGAGAIPFSVDCVPGAAECTGTPGSEFLVGSAVADRIFGLDGSDVLDGNEGDDQLVGDGQAAGAGDGDDAIDGGPGNDILLGLGGADRLDGEGGRDTIHARDYTGDGHPAGQDSVHGGPGRDRIYADDGFVDTIDCGGGKDTVTYDRGLDWVRNCEVKRPVS
jgi:Ca2+-binding RTX toxin-like protein